jgi:hypothetical protein
MAGRARAESSALSERTRESNGLSNVRICVEIFPKAVDGRASSSGVSFSVDEHDAVDQVL